jgi:serine/threonine protein kinase
VYRAHDTNLGREVAIKVLPDATFGDATARARLVREARTAAKLSHPHICTVHDVGEAEGHVYVAMELVDGEPLSACIARGALPPAHVARIGIQLADAVAHAHERGVVHRDLKPANVILQGARSERSTDIRGWYLNLMGHRDEAIAELTRAREVDPMTPLFCADLGWQYWDAGDMEKAAEEARKSFGLVHSERGLHAEAIAAHLKAAQGDPDLRWGLAVSYARAGRREQALRTVAEIEKQPSAMADWGLAQAHAVLGNREEVLRWLERGFQDRFSWMPWLRMKDAGLERPFRPYRADPRYQDLIRRMKLAEQTN